MKCAVRRVTCRQAPTTTQSQNTHSPGTQDGSATRTCLPAASARRWIHRGKIQRWLLHCARMRSSTRCGAAIPATPGRGVTVGGCCGSCYEASRHSAPSYIMNCCWSGSAVRCWSRHRRGDYPTALPDWGWCCTSPTSSVKGQCSWLAGTPPKQEAVKGTPSALPCTKSHPNKTQRRTTKTAAPHHT
jgi:hypothetical protein